LVSFVVAGCSSGQAALPDYKNSLQTRGSVARVERVGWYPAIVLRALFWYEAPPEPVSVSEGITLYRISYWSSYDRHNVLLSGLMALPNDGAVRGTVLYMHGTNTSRVDSPSAPSLQEGLLVSGVFASGGYVVAAPDLSGLGISHAPQPYFINQSTVEQTLDFLRAVQTVAKDMGHPWNSSLYIFGISQGGFNAAVIQRELERLNDPAWKVKASAGIAGPYDMAGIEVPFVMRGISINDSTYLTNLALSYSAYYHQRLESILTSDMAGRARELFDGDHTVDDVLKGMPRNPRELFSKEFLDAFDNKKPNWFLDDLSKNESYAWAPSATFRAYYGTKDIDATPQNTLIFAKEVARRGGHVEVIDIGPQDHARTPFYAVPKIRRWFDALSAETAVRH
jgi:hypothetical protein